MRAQEVILTRTLCHLSLSDWLVLKFPPFNKTGRSYAASHPPYSAARGRVQAYFESYSFKINLDPNGLAGITALKPDLAVAYDWQVEVIAVQVWEKHSRVGETWEDFA